MIVHLGTHAYYGKNVYIEESLIEDIWWTCERWACKGDDKSYLQRHSFVDHAGGQGKVPIKETPNEIMENIRKSKQDKEQGQC